MTCTRLTRRPQAFSRVLLRMVSEAKKKREAAKKAKASAKLNGTTVSPSVSTNAVCVRVAFQTRLSRRLRCQPAVITTCNLRPPAYMNVIAAAYQLFDKNMYPCCTAWRNTCYSMLLATRCKQCTRCARHMTLVCSAELCQSCCLRHQWQWPRKWRYSSRTG